MTDISRLSDGELDALLLAQADPYWQKVAALVGRVVMKCEKWDDEDDDRVAGRVAALVDAGRLESAGDIHKWRFSEVRLPG